MYKKQISWSLATVAFLFVIGINACSKENSKGSQYGKARLQVSLTDAPNPNVKEVWVDIKEVRINMGDSDWITLDNAHPGIYNLLDLTDGKDTLLADAEIPPGSISQIRLILGDRNSIVTNDDDTFNLTTPSAQQSGLKVQIHQDVTGGILYHLILDFDAAKSIVKAGNSGKYLLKPVLRVISFESSGGIVKGVVQPDSVLTTIFAINGPDTIASTFSDTTNGQYLFKDIPGGSYSFAFSPADTAFKDTAVNVTVTTGQTTIVDTVFLPKK